MTDHADTIRRAINEGGRSYQVRSDGRLALDAILAERQQAIDALRMIAAGTDEPWTHEYASAALVSLGETE